MVVLAEKEVAHLIHPIPKTNKTFSGEDARTRWFGNHIKMPFGRHGDL